MERNLSVRLKLEDVNVWHVCTIQRLESRLYLASPSQLLETWLTLFSLPLPVESKQTPTPGWNDEQTPLRTGELHKQQQLSLPIRFALGHSFCVTPKHVLLHKETQDFTNIHAPSLFPIYRYYTVGLMFFILGLGTLLPWNFFMTASLVKTRPHKIWHNMKHMLGFQW